MRKLEAYATGIDRKMPVPLRYPQPTLDSRKLAIEYSSMHAVPKQLSSGEPANRFCRRALIAVAIFAVALATTGCTSLKPIADFGKNASVLAGYPAVAKDYPVSLIRQRLYGQTGSSVSSENIAVRKRDAARLREAQQVLQAYGQALGALAADDLVAYDTEIAALDRSLLAGKFVTTHQVANSAPMAKIGFRIFTDLYRRSKIKQLMITYNPSVQAATAQLVEIVEGGYLTGLSGEVGMFTQLVAGRAKLAVAEQGLDGLPQLINVLADEYEQGLESKAANARAFVTGLRTFAQGHQKLATTVDQVSFNQSVEIARQYAIELGKVIQSFNP